MAEYSYRAFGIGCGATAATPRAAALKFYAENPTKRKCDVIRGISDGVFFSLRYGRGTDTPQSWKDVTKKQAADLPDFATPQPESQS